MLCKVKTNDENSKSLLPGIVRMALGSSIGVPTREKNFRRSNMGVERINDRNIVCF